jgi:hypothetical protein
LRSAVVGSSRAARYAGSQDAPAATLTKSSTTTAKFAGSVGSTPTRRLESTRESSSAPGRRAGLRDSLFPVGWLAL